MLSFEWSWSFLLLPLPWVFRAWLPPATPMQEAALRVPFLEDFKDYTGQNRYRPPNHWSLLVASLAWLLAVTASARPVWLDEAIELPVSGRDLMLAVDLSGSMEERDFEIDGELVNRLTATKFVAGRFIDRRVGDRIGLILFGEQAYLQVPLTFDRKTVKTLLEEAVIGLAGKATAIGDAIGLTIKRLRGRDVESRVLILLTDGANTAGEIDPLKAAELAAAEGLRIYTIGIGADEMTVRRLFGAYRLNPSVGLDEKTLQAIAGKTAGRYFRARDTRELESIYTLLDELEPVEQDRHLFRPTKELYPWPLAIALLLATLLVIAAIQGKVPA